PCGPRHYPFSRRIQQHALGSAFHNRRLHQGLRKRARTFPVLPWDRFAVPDQRHVLLHTGWQPARGRVAGRTWLLGGGGGVDYAWRRRRPGRGGIAIRRDTRRRLARTGLAPFSLPRLQPSLCPRARSATVPRTLRYHSPLATDGEPAWLASQPVPPQAT